MSLTVETAALLVNTLATLAERLAQGTALLRTTRAEGREPTAAELLELDVLDDKERVTLQGKIDARRAEENALKANAVKASGPPG